MISSQVNIEEPPAFAVAAANVATLGVASVLRRREVSEAEAARREHLENLQLPNQLRELLHKEFNTAFGADVEQVSVPTEISAALQIQYTVTRTPAREIVFLDIPAAILSDSLEMRRLFTLYYVLRGKIVRVFSHDLSGEPASAFNGLRMLWGNEAEEKHRIDLDYVPLAHIEELENGKAEIGNVLKLDLRSLFTAKDPAAVGRPAAVSPGRDKPRTLKIFLASSSELSEERDDFDLHFRQRNDEFRKRGIYLQIVRWENFLDKMSETRLQDEYNKAVRDCDIFVCLFFTKTGKFTEEEFDTAHDQFKRTGRPDIYTFFKETQVSMKDLNLKDLNSLFTFKAKLSELGHYHTTYTTTDSLKLKFEVQIDKLLNS